MGKRIFFDCEFIEDGSTIDLISLGAVAMELDGGWAGSFYRCNEECDLSKASPWVEENVLVHLPPRDNPIWTAKENIAQTFLAFAGTNKPEFWAYFADYDWVCLCQLYGRMIDLPKGWPMYCRDLKQFCVDVGNPRLPKMEKEHEHHALNDARWTCGMFEFLVEEARRKGFRFAWLEEEQNGSNNPTF